MWPFRRKRTTPSTAPPAPADLPIQEPDEPYGFGFKITWWAIPSSDTDAVVAAIELQDAQPANWKAGIMHAYQGHVFVTPQVDGWTLVTGISLASDLVEKNGMIRKSLEALSQTFGEAQLFSTHRVVEHHLWAKAVQGKLIRAYAYLGETGETLWDEGEATPEEQKLGFAFFDERSPEAESDTYWERDDLTCADEMSVMNIAKEWSVAPVDLDPFKPTERKLGVLGTEARILQ